jgi:GNAT superfamily N-acetyltransferase
MPHTATLKDGRKLSLQVVRTLSTERAMEIVELLGHKAAPWLRHIESYLDEGKRGVQEGLEWRFHIGTCDGRCVANICTWEHRGIGILSHVFTLPQWRQLGIAGQLMRFVDSDFRRRGGRIMQLNTGYPSVAHRMYRKHGYEDVSGSPGAMIKTRRRNEVDLLFRGKNLVPTPLRWRHWPTANLLFLSDHSSHIRSAGLGIYGNHSLERPLVYHFSGIWDGPARERDWVEVLETPEGVCVAWASLMRDPHWGGTSRRKVFDLFFHPRYSSQAVRLFDRFLLPRGMLAYSTPDDPKNPLLEAAGFKERSVFKNYFGNGQALVIFER